MSYIGAHIGISDGIIEGIKKIQKAGGDIVQIFITNPRQKDITERTYDSLYRVKNYLIENNIRLVIHSSYLTNLARGWSKYSWWIMNLITEIEYAGQMGALGVVVHLGESVGYPQNIAINNMFTAIVHVVNITHKKYPNTLLLIETGAGQGSQLCYNLDDLANFFKKFSVLDDSLQKRIKLCLDSCHLFAAGYDLREEKDVDKLWDNIDKLFELKEISLVHLNDSSKPVGSRLDRHASLGAGEIGTTGINRFFYHCCKNEIPVILETPNHTFEDEIRTLQMLKAKFNNTK